MRSFFAMLWDPHNLQAREAAGEIRRAAGAFLQPGQATLGGVGFFLADLEAGNARASILPLLDEAGQCAGTVYGTLFRKEADASVSARLNAVPPDLAARFIASGGVSILSEAWGSYVAFLGNGANGCVIAEPAASIPCLHAEVSGVTLVFSHLEHCPFLDRSWFTLNLDFIRRMLAYDKLQNGETGLNEVREILGGQRLRLGPGGPKTDFIWNPAEMARRVYSGTAPAAAEALRHCAQSVVKAHTACHSRILVDLSGGFDSSAVLGLACAADTGAEILPVHHATASLDPPEVHYARAAARHCGRELLELVIDPARQLPDLSGHPLSVRPYRQFIGFDLSADMQRAGIDAFDATFTGQGGDHLFLATRSALVFADFLHHRGLTSETGAQLLAAARLSETSIWNVLAECLPSLLPGRQSSSTIRSIEQRQTRLNADDHTRRKLRASIPDWARAARGLPPAKFNQVSSLAHMFQVREPIARSWSRETLHPLISQPLIELCLQIPTYFLSAGGENRSLARQAFAEVLPDLIRRRMTKGDASRQFADYLLANRTTLAGALSEGRLVAERLLAKNAAAQLLRQDHFLADQFGRTMLVAYAIEAWLSAWHAATRGR